MFFITTYENENGLHFSVKNLKDEIIFKSVDHNTQNQCLNAIDSFKINSAMDKRYIREQQDDAPFFYLKAGNGKIIGQSKSFRDNNLMEQEIKSLQQKQKLIK